MHRSSRSSNVSLALVLAGAPIMMIVSSSACAHDSPAESSGATEQGAAEEPDGSHDAHMDSDAGHKESGETGGGAHQHGMKHDFSDPARYAAAFDGPDRDHWQHTTEVMELLDLRPGARVVEVGAGTGYFMSALAQGVGASGRVELLDTEPAMVRYMAQRARDQGLTQVYPVQIQPDDPALETGVDRVLIVNVWHHLDDRTQYAQGLRASLKRDGFVLIVDFEASSPFGPPPKFRLTAQEVARELEPAGYQTEILAETLPHQWVLRARP